MKDVLLSVAMKRKRAIELEMAKLLNEYSEQTGLVISRIEGQATDVSSMTSEYSEFHYHVELFVGLPR